MHGRVSRQVAVIGCEKRVFPIRINGSVTTIRKATARAFEARGLEPETYHPVSDIDDFPRNGGFGGLVIGGSSLGLLEEDLKVPSWRHKVLDFIRKNHGRVPILGICFGHQAVARAFGAGVQEFGPSIVYEAGFRSVSLTRAGIGDPLFIGMPCTFDALFSHFHYVPRPPDGGETLLMGDNPSVQAFRIDGSTWGVQYHPEFTAECVSWLISQRAPRLRARGVDVNSLLDTLHMGYRDDDRILLNFSEIVRHS